MTDLNSNIAQLKEFNSALNNFLKEASKTTSGKFFTLVFVTYFSPLVLLASIGYLQYKYTSKSEYYSQQDKLVADQLIMENVQERIKICIESENIDNVSSKFKCKDALGAYEIQSSKWPPERQKEILDNMAFATMSSEINYYISVNRANQENLKREVMEKNLLQLIFSLFGVIFIVVISIIPPGFVLYKFYKIRNHS